MTERFRGPAASAGDLVDRLEAAQMALLDALAAARRQAGQPAVSIAWGPWDTSAGMTSDLTAADLARLGFPGGTTPLRRALHPQAPAPREPGRYGPPPRRPKPPPYRGR